MLGHIDRKGLRDDEPSRVLERVASLARLGRRLQPGRPALDRRRWPVLLLCRELSGASGAALAATAHNMQAPGYAPGHLVGTHPSNAETRCCKILKCQLHVSFDIAATDLSVVHTARAKAEENLLVGCMLPTCGRNQRRYRQAKLGSGQSSVIRSPRGRAEAE